MNGRRRKYTQRTTITTNVEAAIYQQLQIIANNRHEALTELLDKWMRKYIREYEESLYPTKLHEFSTEKIELPPEEKPGKRAYILTIDLENRDVPKMVSFIHSLDKEHIGLTQGAARTILSTCEQAMENRKNGIPPQEIKA